MKLKTILLIGIGITVAILSLADPTKGEAIPTAKTRSTLSNDSLKKAAFNILDTQCNGCHRKQNPFMIFKEKNMEKRAPKIYQMVFVERRMPKGNEIKLTNEEYATLEKWLFTQEIF